jgi:hypothetical protein
MRLSWLTTVLWLGLIACSKPQRSAVADDPKVKAEVAPTYVLPRDAVVFTLNNDSVARPWLKDHLFGKFFEDRAEFFVIQGSSSEILGAPVSTIILYYLDERHCQSKFILTENIADKLIARYGTFNLTPLDQNNRDLLETKNILIEEDGHKMLNRSFTHVELSWKLQDKIIRYRLEARSQDERFVYTEHIPDYDKIFRTVEKAML